MSLPKNYNINNFNKRVESLNDLIFYTVKYDYVLTGKVVDEFDSDTEITGIKEVNALNEEQAKAKIENWFNVLIQNGIIDSYEIKSAEFKTLYETLHDKKIFDILKFGSPQ